MRARTSLGQSESKYCHKFFAKYSPSGPLGLEPSRCSLVVESARVTLSRDCPKIFSNSPTDMPQYSEATHMPVVAKSHLPAYWANAPTGLNCAFFPRLVQRICKSFERMSSLPVRLYSANFAITVVMAAFTALNADELLPVINHAKRNA